MTADCFLDANVLVYSISSAPSEVVKKEKAVELISKANFGVSAQVLQEFYVTITRKVKQPVGHELAIKLVRELSAFPLVNTTSDLIERGALLSQRYQLSYWDGAVIAVSRTPLRDHPVF